MPCTILEKKQPFFKLIIGIAALLWAPVLFGQSPLDTRKELAEAQQWLANGNYQKAYDAFYHHAQERQNPLAQFTLGLFHQQGWGMASDAEKACQWYAKAAKNGVPAASHFFAQCLQNGTHQPADYAAAIHWYQEAASLGHIISLCSIAELTMLGKGVPKDPQKALEYCQQAASSGSLPAQLHMGQFFLHGDASIRDPHQAAVWFHYAAEQGSREGAYHLGMINLNHFNDQNRALYWLETAASQGYLPAYFPTARLYFHAPVSETTGMPAAENLAKAYLWLSATTQQSKNENELRDSAKMLEKVEQIMPASWKADLDAKISRHLAEFQS